MAEEQKNNNHDKSMEGLFPLILDSIADGVFTVDENFRITSFNSAAEKITGVSRGNALGRPCHEIFKASVCHKGCALRDTLRTGEPRVDVRVDALNANMNSIPMLVSTAVLKDSNGQLLGGVEIFKDVSDMETLRNELQGKQSFRDLIGQSAVMKDIFAIIPQVAEAETPVLVRGPSGTGKELVARAVHDLSPRKDQPFVRVNCGALPDTLLESELFGYRKGAFTGAINNKPGRFQQADGGTLFLDEIGDVSPSFQVKLLRALEEGEVQPLGDTNTMKVDVRLVCATNRDLEAMVREDKFREDLYYRINVIPIEIPTLAERREDIPLLVTHFVKILSARTGRPPAKVARKAMRLLYDYDYPGNVRELRNILERAFVLCARNTIEPQCLPLEVSKNASAYSARSPAAPTRPSDRKIASADKREYVNSESYEARRLRNILDAHNWNRSSAARELGIGRTTLWRRMKEFGLT